MIQDFVCFITGFLKTIGCFRTFDDFSEMIIGKSHPPQAAVFCGFFFSPGGDFT